MAMTLGSCSTWALGSLRTAGSSAKRRRITCREFHDYVRGSTQGGTYKVPLNSPKIVGTYSSRGSRLYQEDALSVHTLSLLPHELQLTLSRQKPPHDWNPEASGPSGLAEQVSFFGIYDGHGGKEVSAYLKDNLPALIEEVQPEEIGKVIDWTMNQHKGYYKRWRGGGLHRWSKWAHALPPEEGSGMTLEERLTLAFLKADQTVLTDIKESQRSGSTGTIALLQSLDEPAQPYFAAKKLHLTIGHCGQVPPQSFPISFPISIPSSLPESISFSIPVRAHSPCQSISLIPLLTTSDTRALLCSRETGEVIALTEQHHAEARVEATRLRRMGAKRLVADSFGESRWMGVIENTRGFGDGEWKPSGVTAEPEVTTRVINGEDHCYLILVTDGLTSLMSDQEIIDLARNSIDPTRAAKTIVHFGEDLGAQDNCTCIVIPLAGWGRVGGKDRTEERREYRRKQAGALNTRMQRM